MKKSAAGFPFQDSAIDVVNLFGSVLHVEKSRHAWICGAGLFVCMGIVLLQLSKADSEPSLEALQGMLHSVADREEVPSDHRSSYASPNFMSPHDHPIAVAGELVLVVNTPSATLDVIDSGSRAVVRRIQVGIDPVCVQVRPDGKEAWVANHVSDSVNVIDLDRSSATYLEVIATIQEFDLETRSTRFDEPVGIAFASDKKAYVALSSENQIAVIDVASRRVTKRIAIPAQDPRSIVVERDRLFVIPFESGNQTQLSGGSKDRIDGDLVTFDIWNHSIENNNVLSLGHVVDIVKHPRVPDRDLFLFDTEDESLIGSVDTLGTLLYGLAVGKNGEVYIAQTDARNDVNGRAGSRKHGLAELQNRAFLNRITRVMFGAEEEPQTEFIDLEPLPPEDPAPGMALATPFALTLANDGRLLVGTATGSDQLYTLDSETGGILGRVKVGAVPEGIALESDSDGRARIAWVLNAASNTVSIIDLVDPRNPRLEATLELEDPTHPTVKRGRIAFSTAAASSSGTYSCASCHPDGHTDQLLWVLNTPIVSDGDQIMPRSTMPVRGLRDTAPFHWDGIPGDPYGGINSAHILRDVEPNSDEAVPESTTRHLIDGGLASTMMRVGDQAINDEGKAGRLSRQERDDMAKFLLSVPYPPAPRRAYDDQLSDQARKGFSLFHIEGDLDPSKSTPNRCGDCHRMPFLVSTNTPGTGMDAPTWRGAYDRWLILPQGRLNVIALDFYERIARRGAPEKEIWNLSWGGRERFNPVWDMVLEMGTGVPGAFARQVTLDSLTASDEVVIDLVESLERSAIEGRLRLKGAGIWTDDGAGRRVTMEFRREGDSVAYWTEEEKPIGLSRQQLLDAAKEGRFVGTLTGKLGGRVDVDHPQPALWTLGPMEQQRGRQDFPMLSESNRTMTISARHLDADPLLLVDGRRVEGNTRLQKDRVVVSLAELPAKGLHFLQLQNPDGLVSNEFLFRVSDPSDLSFKETSLRVLMEQSGLLRLMGKWIDRERKGEGLTLEYRWKLKDQLIEHTSVDPNNQSVALIGIDSEKELVYHRGSDRSGTSFDGQWELPGDGDVMLRLRGSNTKGEPFDLRLRYHFDSQDEMTLTVELPQPIVIHLVRVREN
jgi:YVTN family beta-propeller protein